MTSKNIKILSIGAGIIGIILIIIAIFTIVKSKKTDQSVENLMQDYDELESAYARAIKDIEQLSDDDYENIDSLKQKLRVTLDKIKVEQGAIANNRGKSVSDILLTNEVELTKKKADSILVQKIDQVMNNNKDLKKSNEELKRELEEIEKSLTVMRGYFESEKSKNGKLNALIIHAEEQIKKLEEDKSSTKEQIEEIKKQKDKYELELKVNNKTIEKQTEQINMLVGTLRKVNVNCFFVYEQGEKSKETKIYLTDESLSAQYSQYFVKEKPEIHLIFSLNEDLFKEGVEKLNMKIFNSKNEVVFNTDKSISKSKLEVKVPGNLFQADNYYVELKQGSENLIIGGKYKFKINQ